MILPENMLVRQCIQNSGNYLHISIPPGSLGLGILNASERNRCPILQNTISPLGVIVVGKHSSIFDSDGLKEAEAAYRFVLSREPDNMDTRANLAWCLLLQALHQSGQEMVIAEQRGLQAESHSQLSVPTLSPGPDAKHLLQECLHHSLTVRHLSSRLSNQRDVEKLEALVLMAGGKDLLLSSEESGARIRDKIITALWQASDQDNPDSC